MGSCPDRASRSGCLEEERQTELERSRREPCRLVKGRYSFEIAELPKGWDLDSDGFPQYLGKPRCLTIPICQYYKVGTRLDFRSWKRYTCSGAASTDTGVEAALVAPTVTEDGEGIAEVKALKQRNR